MPAMVSLRTGQVTESSFGERAVSSWIRLINGVVTSEGVKPFQQYLRPVGASIVTPDTGNIRNASCRFFSLGREVGKMVALINYLDRSVVGQEQMVSVVCFVPTATWSSDQHSTTLTINYADNFGKYVIATGATTRVAMSVGVSNTMVASMILHNTKVLVSGAISQGVAASDVYTADVGAVEPTAQIAESNTFGTMQFAQLLDIKQTAFSNALIKAPSSPFVVTLDEYLCIVSGVDNSLGAVVPALADVTRQHRLFRWGSPDTINEWQPDATNIPPQYFSGYLLLPDAGEVLDVVVAFSRVYVIMQRDVVMLTKVGGATGFAQKSLGITFNLDWMSVQTCVSTHKGIFYVNKDGLYRFTGYTVEHLVREAEGVFTLNWLREELGVHFTKFTNLRTGVHLLGQHVPALDSIFWYVQAFSGDPQGSTWDTEISTDGEGLRTYVLVYNYETNAASILQSPVDELWYPMNGHFIGLTKYSRATRTSRNYEFVPRFTDTPTLPDTQIPIDWKTGIFKVKDSQAQLRVTRLFLSALGAGFNSVQVSAELYRDETEVPFLTVSIGTGADFVKTKWRDVRLSARYISFTFSGNIDPSTAGVIQAIGVDATSAGTRY